MENSNNFSSESTSKLLSMVSAKMGISPNELENRIKSGEFNKMFGIDSSVNMNDSMTNILNNPNVQKNLRKNPAANQMIKMFMGGK